MGTGYLGWTPEVTLSTPIPQIILAMEGRFDFAIKTNPFGGKPKDDQAKKRTPEERQAFIKAQKTEFALIKADFRNKARKKNGDIN